MQDRSSMNICRFLWWLKFLFVLIIMVERTSSTEKLDVGKSLNVFGRYAYYGVSMKVMGRNETTTSKSWLFREPLVDVFHNITDTESCLKQPKNLVHADFHLEFCENLQQLFQAYFRDFHIEGMDEPWRAFTTSWTDIMIARNFGIDVNYITTPRSYILVRALRRRMCTKLKNPLDEIDTIPLPRVKALADQVTIGDTESILTFIKNYGSHYIASYSTGNSVYQVFVFHTPVFRRVRTRLQANGVGSLSKNELNTIFSPWFAEQVGTVMSASGNTTVTKWANEALLSKSHLYPYTSLMEMYGNAERFKELDRLLGNEALLSMDLKVLSPAFKDSNTRLWFLEFLLNNMQLWEQNMYSYINMKDTL